MSIITFSIWQLIKENNNNGLRWIVPDKKDFPTEFDENLDSVKGINHVTISNNNDYFFLTVESGTLEPRDKYVIDKTSKKKRKNPKKETEIELLKQLFAFYDYKTNLLYLSDVRNKKIFEDIIHEITEQKFMLKGIYEDKETFLNLLNNVEEIKFTSKEDLFSSDSKKRCSLIDLVGTTEITDLTLDIKTNSHQFNPINFLKDLMTEETEYTLNGLLIRGKDETGFEHVYNQQTFIKKIVIDAEKYSGKYDSEEIKINLQKKIEELKNVTAKQKR